MLSNHKLIEYEVGCVAFGLQDSETVKSVNISHNHVTNRGIMSIRDCLVKNNTIMELNISHNYITGVSINNLISMNSSLLKLDISGISIIFLKQK